MLPCGGQQAFAAAPSFASGAETFFLSGCIAFATGVLTCFCALSAPLFFGLILCQRGARLAWPLVAVKRRAPFPQRFPLLGCSPLLFLTEKSAKLRAQLIRIK